MKTLEEYETMDYDLVVIQGGDEDQVMYWAYSPDLDPLVFYGVGETRQKAIESFEETREEMTAYFFSVGRNVSEPKRRDCAPVEIKLELVPIKQGDND